MIASDILDGVSKTLNDEGRVRWRTDMLLEFLTGAMRQTVLCRPDAYSEFRSVKLVPGSSRQSIPSDAARFLGLTRNMGSDGNTPGFPITPTTREIMDQAMVYWHNEDAVISDTIDHYVFLPDMPKNFYVVPIPGNNVYVEIMLSLHVPAVEAMSSELPLDEQWAEPLREYVLYRAYGVNQASPSDRQLASMHLQNFYTSLGQESAAKLLSNPIKPTTGASDNGNS